MDWEYYFQDYERKERKVSTTPIVLFAHLICFIVVSRFYNGNAGDDMVAKKNEQAETFSVRRGMKTRKHGNIPSESQLPADVPILTDGAQTAGFGRLTG